MELIVLESLSDPRAISAAARQHNISRSLLLICKRFTVRTLTDQAGILTWAQGMRSWISDAGHRLTSLVSVSASPACGFMPFSLHVSMSEAMIAQLAPPSLLPAKSAFLRLSAMGRIDRSTVLLSISTRPSSRRRQSPIV